MGAVPMSTAAAKTAAAAGAAAALPGPNGPPSSLGSRKGRNSNSCAYGNTTPAARPGGLSLSLSQAHLPPVPLSLRLPSAESRHMPTSAALSPLLHPHAAHPHLPHGAAQWRNQRPSAPAASSAAAAAAAGELSFLTLRSSNGRGPLSRQHQRQRLRPTTAPPTTAAGRPCWSTSIAAAAAAEGHGQADSTTSTKSASASASTGAGAGAGVGRGCRIIGTGSAVPSTVVSNDDLSTIVDTTDDWIATRTGIRRRHVLLESESLTSIAAEASRRALAMAGVDPSDVDLIILATSSPDDIFGGACMIQREVGCSKAVAFDITAACSGFVVGLVTASRFIKGGGFDTVLVVGADALSRYVDWTDRGTCVLFGDGSGAVVVRATKDGEEDGLLGFDMHSDGNGAKHLHATISAGCTSAPIINGKPLSQLPPAVAAATTAAAAAAATSPVAVGSAAEAVEAASGGAVAVASLPVVDGAAAAAAAAAAAPVHVHAEGGEAAPVTVSLPGKAEPSFIAMNGREVYKFAVTSVPQVLNGALAQAGLTVDDVNWLLLHQANQRIMDAVASKLGLPAEAVLSNVASYGNTSAASIPLALDEAVRAGKVKPGDVVACAGFGAGLTWASAILRYG